MVYPNENDRLNPTGGTQPMGAQHTGAAADAAKQTAAEAKDQAKDVAANAGDRAKDLAATAKDEAASVKDTAMAVGGDVVETAKAQGADVVEEAKARGGELLDEGIAQVKAGAETGQNKLAEVARAFTGELDDLLAGKGTATNGPAASLMQSAKSLTDQTASWLEEKGPEDILDDVRRFAARKPVQFLAISAGLGFLGARLVRGIQENAADEREAREFRHGDRAQLTPTYQESAYSRSYGTGTQAPTARFADPQPLPTTGAQYGSQAQFGGQSTLRTQPGDLEQNLPFNGQGYGADTTAQYGIEQETDLDAQRPYGQDGGERR